jgi:DNA-binding NtrC family response regulator
MHAVGEIRQAEWDVCLAALSPEDEAELRREIEAKLTPTLLLPIRITGVADDPAGTAQDIRLSVNQDELIMLVIAVLNARRVQEDTMRIHGDLKNRNRGAESALDTLAPAKRDIKPLHEIERLYILEVLEHCRGNRTRASELLGIDRVTLYHKLKQYGWQRDRNGTGPAEPPNS